MSTTNSNRTVSHTHDATRGGLGYLTFALSEQIYIGGSVVESVGGFF
jgi:hypothetical protein